MRTTQRRINVRGRPRETRSGPHAGFPCNVGPVRWIRLAMRPSTVVLSVAALIAAPLPVGQPSARDPSLSPPPLPTVVPPLCAQAFVPNLGQWGGDIGHRLRVPAGEVSFGARAFTLSAPSRAPGAGGAAVRFAMVGARPCAVRAEERQAGVHNYFLGSDPQRWRTHVPRYGRLRYVTAWPGVDLVGYVRDGQFEYDLELAAGADLTQVVFAVEGADRLTLASDGALSIDTAIGTLRQSPPRTFAVAAGGGRRAIESRCVLLGRDRFGFVVPEWNGDDALVLDPGLAWSTFLGGAANLDAVRDVHVAATGMVTVVGTTGASDFPTTPGAWNTTYNVADGFLSRFDPTQTGAQQLVYSTFIGGSGSETLHALAVQQDGVVTVVGHTLSPDFPQTNGWVYRAWLGEIVVVRLDPSQLGAAQLVFSSPFGGMGGDTALSVAVDGAGRTVLGGWTTSTNFPVSGNALQGLSNGNGGGGAFDGVIAVLDPTGNVTYSTYLGRTADDSVKRVAWLGGVITVCGDTASSAFPTTAGAFATTYGGGAKDTFVLRLDPALPPAAQMLYSTFFGGSNEDLANALAVDAAGVITLGGETASTDLPTSAGAFDTTLGGSRDVFAARLDPTRSGAQQLLFATYLGGAGFDLGGFAAVDGAGAIVLAGSTGSADFPTTPGAYDRTRGGLNAFVALLDPAQTGARQLRYGTFIGGTRTDTVFGVAREPGGSATVVGQTDATDFPTTAGAFDTTYNGVQDGFVARVDLLPTGVRAFGASSPGCDGPLAIGVNSWPQRGNAAFAFTCSGAPPSAPGVLALSSATLTAPLPVLGIGLWVDPFAALFLTLQATSTASGGGFAPLPIPGQASIVGFRLAAQFVWVGPTAPPPCPPLGFSATGGLEITVQP